MKAQLLDIFTYILLVENRDTGVENSAYCALAPLKREFIQTTARQELPEWWS